MSNELKPFMREVLEFISLLRASEKERYETQKKFMTDTIKTLKNISETIKNSSEFIRNNMEKMKEMLSTDIALLKKESSLDSLKNANKTLEESIEMVQRGVQIMEYRQAMTGTRSMLDDIQAKISQGGGVQKRSAPTPKAAPPVKKSKKVAPVIEEEINEEEIEAPGARNLRPSQITSQIPGHALEKATFKDTSSEKKEDQKKKGKKFHIDF